MENPLPPRLITIHPWIIAILLALLALPVYASEWIYTVVEGDNLWDFSEKHLDSVLRFDQLRKLNNVKNPRRMQPGSRLRVPMKWIRSNAVPARIAAVKGQVQLVRSDSTKQSALSSGSLIRLGDRIKTGSNSSVAIEFADGTALTLHSYSEIRFDHLSAHGKTGMVDSRLHLIDGRLQTRVRPTVGPGSRFEIHTPSAITAVRGTAYRTAVTMNGEYSHVEVLEGKVQVAGADNRKLIHAGFGTRIAKGEAPTPPRKLLPAPNLKQVAEPIRQLNWQLNWEPIKDAINYRVEISANQELDVLIGEEVTPHPRFTLPDLLDERYWVRIRGIDSDGLEGKSVVQSILFDTQPQPPISLNPPVDSVLRANAAELQWTASADAERYMLEIATDPAFENTVLKLADIDTTHYQTTGITEPATYYWRVTSIAANNELGPAGVVRSWQLKAVPDAVDSTVLAKDDLLVASWRQGSPEQKYQVQLAHEPEFKDIELDEVTVEPEISFEQRFGQVRYLRVRIIEADGYQGPWGSVQRIDPPPDNGIWIVPTIFALGVFLL
ncbi:MAG: FecR domain-containing protein [Candidatus Thiodiazotropha sp. (ex Lucinoma annulata)]|nr:FecR domain-containing protein [Candidatus Thiodiazotropha sp. (ex Lucinoma annulata)]